ncbi:glycosyltransferase family A protein [Candidatus Methylomirabilis sp.]|uniref:glycosyltransferase n=1 Tax=Candidatus Methylomirabilis sp. TaxID=2032687 RepID=UPI003076427D
MNGHSCGSSETPTLSLILCSRNDQYMGNSRWRLETTLNYLADQVHNAGRSGQVEVLVADWGSEVPLRDTVRLTKAAAEIVSFLWIPPGIARTLQKDSSFPEVLALNSAARRAKGEYIGRIDQDTLVGRRFLEVFFDLHEGRRQLDVPLSLALMYTNRREISYRFSVRCPPYPQVDRLVKVFGKRFPVLHDPRRPFWTYLVGIWLVHRALWLECEGYDEQLIYYNWMEVDMILRLKQKFSIVDLGLEVDYSFYHLEHVHPKVRRSTCHTLKNPTIDYQTPSPKILKPNGDRWGLISFPIEVLKGSSYVVGSTHRLGGNLVDWLAWCYLVLLAGMQMGGDRVISFMLPFYNRWHYRASTVARVARCNPPLKWPRALIDLWRERRTRQTAANNNSPDTAER